MEENIIECKNLTHYYGKRLIYENLNFSVKKGHIMGLLGKNGCGKTTTINIEWLSATSFRGVFDLWGIDPEFESGNKTAFRIFDRGTYTVLVYEYLPDREILFRFL